MESCLSCFNDLYEDREYERVGRMKRVHSITTSKQRLSERQFWREIGYEASAENDVDSNEHDEDRRAISQ